MGRWAEGGELERIKALPITERTLAEVVFLQGEKIKDLTKKVDVLVSARAEVK